jgi:hypothetical protein
MDAQPSDLTAVLRVIDFLADPVSYRAKIAELLAATNAAQATIDQASAASAGLDQKKVEQAEKMKATFADHQSRLDDDRETFKRTAAGQSAELLRREQAVTRAEAANTAEAQRCAELRADLEARITAINRAADPRPMLRAVPA